MVATTTAPAPAANEMYFVCQQKRTKTKMLPIHFVKFIGHNVKVSPGFCCNYFPTKWPTSTTSHLSFYHCVDRPKKIEPKKKPPKKQRGGQRNGKCRKKETISNTSVEWYMHRAVCMSYMVESSLRAACAMCIWHAIALHRLSSASDASQVSHVQRTHTVIRQDT